MRVLFGKFKTVCDNSGKTVSVYMYLDWASDPGFILLIFPG